METNSCFKKRSWICYCAAAKSSSSRCAHFVFESRVISAGLEVLRLRFPSTVSDPLHQRFIITTTVLKEVIKPTLKLAHLLVFLKDSLTNTTRKLSKIPRPLSLKLSQPTHRNRPGLDNLWVDALV